MLYNKLIVVKLDKFFDLQMDDVSSIYVIVNNM